MSEINGIIPVMITPFTKDNKIDYQSLDNLIEWYLNCGVNALFSVCQSSEMQFLSIQERLDLAKHVISTVNNRIPVIASGHISDEIQAQIDELNAMAELKPDALVLVSNHLDPQKKGSSEFFKNLDILLKNLPSNIPLGMYECPAPYRRLLSDDELKYMADSGRFVILKDVSCDLPTVVRRVKICEGTPLKIVNANAAIAYPAMLAGARGFCGVMNNVHPELYVWLLSQGNKRSELADNVARFLSLSALVEKYGYPGTAKYYLEKKGILVTHISRVNKGDILEENWALDVIVDEIARGTQYYMDKISKVK